jgi:hypothetical protein
LSTIVGGGGAARVARAIHLPHAARCEKRDDLIGADAGAGSKSHGIGIIRGAVVKLTRASFLRRRIPKTPSVSVSIRGTTIAEVPKR